MRDRERAVPRYNRFRQLLRLKPAGSFEELTDNAEWARELRKSDRFFTEDYSSRLYSQIGLNWISRNDMSSVLLRHYPELKPALWRSENAFAPWRTVH